MEEKAAGGKGVKVLMVVLAGLSGLLIAGVLLLLLFNPFANQMGELNLNRRFDPSQPVPIERNGLWGYIDTSGNWVLEPQYEKALPFFGEYAVVNLANSTQVITRGGRVMLETGKNRVVHDEYSDTWLVGGVVYDANLKRVSPKNLEVKSGKFGFYTYLSVGGEATYGVTNARGKAVWECAGGPCSLDAAARLPGLEAYGAVKVASGETQIVNLTKGKLVATYPEGTLVVAQDNNFFQVITASGETQQVYAWEGRLALEGAWGAKYYLADTKGNRLFADLGENYDKAAYGARYAYLELPDKWTFLGSSDAWTLSDLLTGYRTFSCGNLVGLKSPRDEAMPCFYKSLDLSEPEIFVWLKQKNGRQIVMTERSETFALYDLGTKQEVATAMLTWRNLDNSPFFVSYDPEATELKVYNAVSGVVTALVGVRSGKYAAGANYLVVEGEGETVYYNNRLQAFYRI